MKNKLEKLLLSYDGKQKQLDNIDKFFKKEQKKILNKKELEC